MSRLCCVIEGAYIHSVPTRQAVARILVLQLETKSQLGRPKGRWECIELCVINRLLG